MRQTDKHFVWGFVIMFSIICICITLIVLWYHPITFRFEMDNNTLEAVKSINWTVIKEVNK